MARQRGREWHGTIDTQSLAVEGEYKELAWGPCGGVGWGNSTQLPRHVHYSKGTYSLS